MIRPKFLASAFTVWPAEKNESTHTKQSTADKNKKVSLGFFIMTSADIIKNRKKSKRGKNIVKKEYLSNMK